MKLSHIVSHLEYKIYGSIDVDIKGIDYDSRRVRQGWVFVALPGHHVDGKKFIPAALAAGAKVIVSNEYQKLDGATLVVVSDPLFALAELSARFYRHPDRKLFLVGVTGTNGKTTITYFLETIFKKIKKHPGVMGTINYRYGNKSVPAPNTTPQASDVYRIFHEMVKDRCQAAVMEVSSHALALGRVEGVEFDMAIFTNLTRDHLDFHETMEEYFRAKALLFINLGFGEKEQPKFAIINIDDPWGSKLLDFAPRARIVTYGLNEKADVRASRIRISSKGTDFLLITPSGRRKMHLSHLGQHNVYNALAAIAASLSAGIAFDDIFEAMESAPAVPGRLERIESGQPFTVVVDYAHTDDALKNVLTALRQIRPARLITVFGCGGDRDRSKRPLMGDVATALSDFVFITSDNPRSEEPQRIALDIEVGVRRRHRNNYQVLLDREQAIAAAIAMARKGDVILIAGKGHEQYQIVGNQVLHFNDTETAKKYLQNNQRPTAVKYTTAANTQI